MLIVLDNCEHVIVAAAEIAEHLLRRCPGLRILATSREGLRVGGEIIWAVPPLGVDDAVQLFVRHQGAVGGRLTSSADLVQLVSQICVRLDGLPLAIELAAARTRAFSIEQISSRLQDVFRLLTGGSRTALPRQQTLRAVIDWSYDLLFDDERRVFERLSVFPGGCDLPTAEAVCADEGLQASELADIVQALADKSLVVALPAGGDPRFTQLQTLAQYAHEKLAERGDAERTRNAMAAHFTRLCARSAAAYVGDDQRGWLMAVDRERDNIRGALEWAVANDDAESALLIAGGMGWPHWLAGTTVEGASLARRRLRVPRGGERRGTGARLDRSRAHRFPARTTRTRRRRHGGGTGGLPRTGRRRVDGARVLLLRRVRRRARGARRGATASARGARLLPGVARSAVRARRACVLDREDRVARRGPRARRGVLPSGSRWLLAHRPTDDAHDVPRLRGRLRGAGRGVRRGDRAPRGSDRDQRRARPARLQRRAPRPARLVARPRRRDRACTRRVRTGARSRPAPRPPGGDLQRPQRARRAAPASRAQRRRGHGRDRSARDPCSRQPTPPVEPRRRTRRRRHRRGVLLRRPRRLRRRPGVAGRGGTTARAGRRGARRARP